MRAKLTKLDFSKTLLMGILNITPDSFSDGGAFYDRKKAVRRAFEIEAEGADIIDIGAQSSRPNAEPVSEAEEMDRLLPVLDSVIRKLSIPISVDTYRWRVAEEALKLGASIINDITALKDHSLGRLVKEHSAYIVLMHMKGDPKTMQKAPSYKNGVVPEIVSYLRSAAVSAEKLGIQPDRIIIDPGIGFGKTVGHNLEIIRELREFQLLKKRIMIGTSRKNFIGKITNKGVLDREFGTAATVAASIMNGADIVRVHNVAAMKDVRDVVDSITGKNR